MTKNKAFAVARELSVKCDEPHMFAVKIGGGCLCDVRVAGDGWVLLTLFINLLERTMENLKLQHQTEFRELLIVALQRYLADTKPADRKETLSDKQRKKRIDCNKKIIAALESVL